MQRSRKMWCTSRRKISQKKSRNNRNGITKGRCVGRRWNPSQESSRNTQGFWTAPLESIQFLLVALVRIGYSGQTAIIIREAGWHVAHIVGNSTRKRKMSKTYVGLVHWQKGYFPSHRVTKFLGTNQNVHVCFHYSFSLTSQMNLD